MRLNKFIALLIVPAMLSFADPGVRTIQDFRLKSVSGKFVSLSDYPAARGFIVVFTCNHCPFAKMYFQRLNELEQKYKKAGVPLLAICSTDTVSYEQDTYANMKAKAQAEHFTFPYLCDGSQAVARNFGALKTPHAFVLWKESGQWVVKYSGAIDDNGAHPELVQHPYVANAVDELLAGRQLTVKEAKSVGCQLNFRK